MEQFPDIIAFHLWISLLFFYKIELRNEAFQEITRHEAQWLLDLLKEIFQFESAYSILRRNCRVSIWLISHRGVVWTKKIKCFESQSDCKYPQRRFQDHSFRFGCLPGPEDELEILIAPKRKQQQQKKTRKTVSLVMISRKFAQNVGMTFIKQSHNGRKPLMFM